MCDTTIKNLISRAWKNESFAFDPGEHFVDETVTIHVSGTVKKHADTMVAPTASVPLLPVIALFWEKSGIARDHALRILKEALIEALENGKSRDEQIEARLKDVEKAVETVKRDLIAALPRQKRSGRITHDLTLEVLPISDDAHTTAVA
jgi:hypothetical protein